MKLLYNFCVLLLCMIGAITNAQTTTDSIKTVVNRLFIAMKNADGAAVKEVFAQTATLQTLRADSTGKISVMQEPVDSFAATVGKIPKGTADEQIRFETIKIDGPLAVVWTPYRFYFKRQFHHCGVNVFQLVRLNGSWKIQGLIDTRRKTGCP